MQHVEVCIPCVLGFHWECDEEDCCCGNTLISATGGNKRGGPAKSDEEVTDPGSTGRKRAAVLYPITDDMVCEWAGLKSACGGVFPIVGCVGDPVRNKATHRHHGPDKNTLNNSEGNVHRICVFCHNRWHTLNDPAYGDLKTLPDAIPHDPDTKATVEEILANEVMWQKRKVKEATDE